MEEAYLLATGKVTLPAEGTTKYERLKALAKKFYRDWQTEPGEDWNSLYEVVGAGTVTATDTFDLDTDIHKVSKRDGDYVRIVTTDDQKINFILVPATTLYKYRNGNAVAHVGTTLKFSRTFTSTDQEFGGTIEVPAFIKLDDLESESDDVLIDNTAWLPIKMASQYILSDAQLSYQYPDLVEQANELMRGMKLANGTQYDTYSTGEDFFANGYEQSDEFAGAS